tara:strand:+ start:11961 stop:12194 length:234 start_codon:yes stop_codon:yes gene_type:complete
MSEEQKQQKNPPPMRFRDTLMSVLAAALGVQSSKARERDFSHGKPSHFVLLGIGFTALFVLVVLGVVKLVLHLSGVS